MAGLNGGVLALAELRGIFLKVGIDYDFQRQDTSTIISFTLPIRRGGIFGYGTHLRVDWLPDRGNSWAVGVQIPLEPHMGKTRPRDTDVAMPRAKKPPVRAAMDSGVAEAMREVRASSRAVAVLSTAFRPDDKSDRLKSLERSRQQIREFKTLITQTSSLRQKGASMESETRLLHDQLDLAFGLAAGVGEGQARCVGAPIANAARAVVLDEVLYPYNRLCGQYKKPDARRGSVLYTLGAPGQLDHGARLGLDARALGRAPGRGRAARLPRLRDRTVLYMTVASQNKDARGMMTDGEVLQVTAGPWAPWVVSDMWMLAGSTTWLESQEDLDRLLPPYGEWQRRIGRWLRKVL